MMRVQTSIYTDVQDSVQKARQTRRRYVKLPQVAENLHAKNETLRFRKIPALASHEMTRGVSA
jgi:hypothetical protein